MDELALWNRVLRTHRTIVSTPQVLLDALGHGYISVGRDISLLVFDEAHHAVDDHPYNRIFTGSYPVETNMCKTPWKCLGPYRKIYGGNGNILESFKIEKNLDSIIRRPHRHHSELALFIHRLHLQAHRVLPTRISPFYQSCFSSFDCQQFGHRTGPLCHKFSCPTQVSNPRIRELS